MVRIVTEGLLLGLSTGAYCLGTCMIFFMPYLLGEGRQGVPENLGKILFFMLGRLVAYIGFALGVGFLGMKYRNLFTVKFSYFSLIIVSLLMIAYALTGNFGKLKFCRRIIHHFSSKRMPFALGVFSGLNPCVPFLIGAVRIWTIESISLGVVLFLAFFLGTSVYMIPLVFVSYLNRIKRLKQIGLIIALLSGLWFLFVAIAGLLN